MQLHLIARFHREVLDFVTHFTLPHPDLHDAIGIRIPAEPVSSNGDRGSEGWWWGASGVVAASFGNLPKFSTKFP